MKYNHAIQRLCLCATYLVVLGANCSTGTKRPPMTKTKHTDGYTDDYKLERIGYAGSCTKNESDTLPPSSKKRVEDLDSSSYEDWYNFPEKWEKSQRKEDAKWNAFWAQSPEVWQALYKKNDQEWITFWDKQIEEFGAFWKTAKKECYKFCRDTELIYKELYSKPYDAASATRFWSTCQEGKDIADTFDDIAQKAVDAFAQKLEEKAEARERFLYEEWSKEQEQEQKAYEDEDRLRKVQEIQEAYAVLGLPINATIKEAKATHIKLSLKYHPDKQATYIHQDPTLQNLTEEQMNKKITEAQATATEEMKKINGAWKIIKEHLGI